MYVFDSLFAGLLDGGTRHDFALMVLFFNNGPTPLSVRETEKGAKAKATTDERPALLCLLTGDVTVCSIGHS